MSGFCRTKPIACKLLGLVDLRNEARMGGGCPAPDLRNEARGLEVVRLGILRSEGRALVEEAAGVESVLEGVVFRGVLAGFGFWDGRFRRVVAIDGGSRFAVHAWLLFRFGYSMAAEVDRVILAVSC